MKEAFWECVVSFVLLMFAMIMTAEWLISMGVHPRALLVLWAMAWSLIGWLRVGFAERKMQLMRKFLRDGVADVLADKAQRLDTLYGEEIYYYQLLREDPADRAGLLRQLRRTKRAIRKAKPNFWRAVRFALDNKLIKQKPNSYRDMLPKKDRAA